MTGTADTEELAFTPAWEQARMIRSGAISPSQLVEFYLERISRINPIVNAYISVAAEEAIRAARDAEARLVAGDSAPFLGVPISIKDLVDVAGMPTSRGVGGFRDRIADADEHVVARLRGAGFVILGKTNVPELGSTCTTESMSFGPCRNPWKLSHSTGGSSGGAAAAVAAGLCPVAHGSDGGGSLRTPAAACGVFTIKPSRGRVSAAPLASSLTSTSGPLAHTVRDAAAMLDAMCGYVPGDAYWQAEPVRPFAEQARTEPGRLRIAVSLDDGPGAPVHPVVRAATRHTADLLAELGHQVEDAAPDGWTTDRVVHVVLTLAATGQAALAPQLPPIDTLDPITQRFIAHGRGVSGVDFALAEAEVLSWSRGWAGFFEDYDVLLTPQNAISPPPLGWLLEDPDPREVLRRSWSFAPFTAQWNFTGQPAATVPAGFDDEGLPLAVQLVGRAGDEATLIRLSAQLESARPWRTRRPVLATS